MFSNKRQKKNRSISTSRVRGFSNFKTIALIVIFVVLVVGIFYGIIISNKTKAESITQDMVLTQLKEILVLPDFAPDKMMRVSDSKELSSQDEFYKNTENGDYIIIYKNNLALIYNFDKNLIKNIKTR